MNKYELVYIITPDIDEEARKVVHTRVQDLIAQNSGEVTKVDDWGKRRLAYAIEDRNEGWYVLVNFNAESEVPREIERNLGNSCPALSDHPRAGKALQREAPSRAHRARCRSGPRC